MEAIVFKKEDRTTFSLPSLNRKTRTNISSIPSNSFCFLNCIHYRNMTDSQSNSKEQNHAATLNFDLDLKCRIPRPKMIDTLTRNG